MRRVGDLAMARAGPELADRVCIKRKLENSQIILK